MLPASKLMSAIAPVAANVSSAHSAAIDGAKCGALRQNEALKQKNDGTNPNGSPNALSPRQLMAAAMLVRGKSVTETAKELGVGRATVDRWKRLAAFDAEVRRQVTASTGQRKSVDPAGSQAPQRRLSPMELIAEIEARHRRSRPAGN